MTNLVEIVKERAKLNARNDRLQRRYQKARSLIDARQSALIEAEALLMNGLDAARINHARDIIRIQGRATDICHGSYDDQNRKHTRRDAVEYAKRVIADGGEKLASEYVGVKNYEGFGDQREDHKYGYGPRHGDIVFSIGLSKQARARELTNSEIEDALYLLNALPEIEAIRAKVA